MSADSMENKGHPLRGFAAMIAAGRGEEERAAARNGGVAAHEKGTAHEWTHESGKAAGRRGGLEAGKRQREAKEAAERDIEKDTGT